MKKWTEVNVFTGSKILDEDMPSSAAGHGNIAGLGVGPQGEPGVDPKKKKKRLTLIDRENNRLDGRTKSYREHRRKLESARFKKQEQKKNSKFTESVTNRMKTFCVEKHVEDLEVDERELTGKELKDREHNVKKLKKHLGKFKDRYGKDGEPIMYAIATRDAKKDKKYEYVNYPYSPVDTMKPIADLGDIPNYYGTKLNAQKAKKKVKRNA